MKRFKILAVCESQFKYVRKKREEVFKVKAKDFHEAVEKIKKFFQGDSNAKNNKYHFENKTNKSN